MSTLQRIAALAQAEHQGKITAEQQAVLNELRARAKAKNQTLAGYIEPILMMGSGAVAEPVSGFVGLAGLPFGVDAAANAVRRTQDALTYQPKTQKAQQNLQKLGKVIQPIAEPLGKARDYVSDKAADAFGPEVGTAVYTGITAAPDLLGLKGAKVAGKAGKLGKQYELGDISGQAFGQRGAVSSIKPLVDEFGDLVEHPDKVTVYHTSPGEISKIEPEYGTGLFGDNLFFADDPYQLGDWTDETRVYRMELDDNDILEADRVAFMDIEDWGGEGNYKIYRNSVEKMKDIIESSVDEDSLANYLSDNDIDILEFSEDVLSEKTSVFDLADYGADSEILAVVSWTQQKALGDLGRDTGYKAVSATDEQGRVIIAPMMGRESELVDVTKWKK